MTKTPSDNFHRLMTSLRKQKAVVDFQKRKDHYILFGLYIVKPSNGLWLVTDLQQDIVHAVFHNKTAATSWCILAQNNLWADAFELANADNVYTRMLNNITYCKHFANKIKTDFNLTLQQSRYSEYLVQKKHHQRKMDKLINFAKYIQNKGLQNETSRSHTR